MTFTIPTWALYALAASSALADCQRSTTSTPPSPRTLHERPAMTTIPDHVGRAILQEQADAK